MEIICYDTPQDSFFVINTVLDFDQIPQNCMGVLLCGEKNLIEKVFSEKELIKSNRVFIFEDKETLCLFKAFFDHLMETDEGSIADYWTTIGSAKNRIKIIYKCGDQTEHPTVLGFEDFNLSLKGDLSKKEFIAIFQRNKNIKSNNMTFINKVADCFKFADLFLCNIESMASEQKEDYFVEIFSWYEGI